MLLSGINAGASSGNLCAFLSGNQAYNTQMRYLNDGWPIKFLQTAQAGQPPGGWWQQVLLHLVCSIKKVVTSLKIFLKLVLFIACNSRFGKIKSRKFCATVLFGEPMQALA
jgi:hypothetical protein